MSLRIKLVVLVLGLLGVLFTGLGAYLDASIEPWSAEVQDRELEQKIDAIAARLELEDGELEVEHDEDISGAYRIDDPNGRAILARGSTFPRAAREGLETVTAEDGRAWRISTREVVPEHGDAVMLSVAAPVGRFSELAQRIRFGLLAALALGAGLGALGAVLIAQLISAPVRRLAGELAQIEARSLDRRLDVRGLDPDLLRLATALNGTLDRLEAAFRQQRELVARASHALRTPLASILATTEVALRRERSTDEYRSTLSDVKSSSSEAAQLVDQLLKLGRADVARASLATERVELAGLGAELLRSFGARASEAQLRLDIALGGAIEADPLRLRELLEALLDNAIRYTRKGGEVGVRSRPAHDGVQIEVWDTGRGIEPSEREQVFERFFRGSAAQQSGQPGTGLGLAIVRAIVDAHGASIRVEPNDGGGTRFVTTWPQTRSSERSSI